MYETRGTVKVIGDLQTFASGFTKREFVVTTQDKFPQDLKFELVKDKCALLDSYQVGDEVAVNFDIRGNEYNGKYFVNLTCWKLQRGGDQHAQPSQQRGARPASQAGPARQPARNAEPHPSELRNEDDFDDDIPF